MDGEVHVEMEMEYVTVRAHPLRRSWRLAVVLSVQNALVAVCLAVSFYCFWLEHQRVSSYKKTDFIYACLSLFFNNQKEPENSAHTDLKSTQSVFITYTG